MLFEVTDNDLKSLVKVVAATKYSNGFVLEAKQGKIVINSFINGKINLFFRRISGNGKVVINDSCSANPKEKSIISKISELYCIDCNENSTLEIHRTPDSIGEVSLFGLSFEMDDEVAKNWKNIIKRCKSFGGIKILNNKLIALEGGYLEPASSIELIKTTPSDTTSIRDNKLFFKYKCEINELVINTENVQEPLFINREPPTPIISPSKPIDVPVTYNTINSIKNNIEDIKSYKDKVIYDSHSINGISRKNFAMLKDKTVKFIESGNQSYIGIKPGGNFCLNISDLEPNHYYLVVINGKKLSGNGKIKVGFSSAGIVQDNKLLNFDSTQADRSADLKIGNKSYPEEQFKLHLISPSDATGEVIISRIMIISSLLNKLPQNQKTAVISNNSLFGFKFDIPITESSNFDDSIKNSNRKASLFFKENLEKIESLPFNFYPQTFNSSQYVASILNQTHDSRVIDFYNQFEEFDKASQSDLAFTKLGEIKSSDRIFLEEWASNINLSAHDIDKLSNCRTIITPSIRNAFILKHSLKGKNIGIRVGEKLRFIPRNIQFNPKKYWVYIEKHPAFTSKIVKMWDESLPPLYIVGSNINVPRFINKFSEHESYFNLVSLLANSSGYLDFNSCLQYKSSWIDLALNLGCSVVTNNCNYVDKAKILNITTNDEINKSLIVSDLINPIKKDVNWNYNLKVIENIKKIIGDLND
jgi:hypothetical protein